MKDTLAVSIRKKLILFFVALAIFLIFGVSAAIFYHYNSYLIDSDDFNLYLFLYGILGIALLIFFTILFFFKFISRCFFVLWKWLRLVTLYFFNGVRYLLYMLRWSLSLKKGTLIIVEKLPDQPNSGIGKKLKKWSSKHTCCFLHRNQYIIFILKEKNINRRLILWIKAGCLLRKINHCLLSWDHHRISLLADADFSDSVIAITDYIINTVNEKLTFSVYISNCVTAPGFDVFYEKSEKGRDIVEFTAISENDDIDHYDKKYYDHLLASGAIYHTVKNRQLGWYYIANINALINKIKKASLNIHHDDIGSDPLNLNYLCFCRQQAYPDWIQLADKYQEHLKQIDNKTHFWRRYGFSSLFVILMTLLTTSFIVNYTNIHRQIMYLPKHNFAAPFSGIADVEKYHDTYQNIFSHWGLYQGDKIYSKIKLLYNQQIQKNFIPPLTAFLETNLEQQLELNQPINIESALKAYFMLIIPEKYDAAYMISYLKTINESLYADPLIKQQFIFMGMNGFHSVKKNEELIVNAEKKLPKLTFRINTVLQKFSADSGDINVFPSNLSRFLAIVVVPRVPEFYTKKGYKIFRSNLHYIYDLLNKDNWIYSDDDLPKRETEILIQKLYYQQYISHWQKAMKKTQIIKFNSLDHTEIMLHGIAKHHVISKMINAIIQNAYIPKTDNNKLVLAIDNQLSPLIYYQQSKERNELNDKLAELYQLIINLHSEDSPAKAVFYLLKEGEETNNIRQLSDLQVQINGIAEPFVQKISKQILANTSEALFNTAQNYVQRQWDSVFSIVDHVILYFYPFNSSSLVDSTQKQWNDLFSDTGIVTVFMRENIDDFINFDTGTVKTLYGSHLTLSKNMLESFIAFHKINKALFVKNQINFNFFIKPDKLSKNAKSVDISMLNKRYQYFHGPIVPYHFVSSVKTLDTKSYLVWSNFSNKRINIETSGYWSWLRLLKRGKLQYIGGDQWLLHFEEKGYYADYIVENNAGLSLLLSDDVVNLTVDRYL